MFLAFFSIHVVCLIVMCVDLLRCCAKAVLTEAVQDYANNRRPFHLSLLRCMCDWKEHSVALLRPGLPVSALQTKRNVAGVIRFDDVLVVEMCGITAGAFGNSSPDMSHPAMHAARLSL